MSAITVEHHPLVPVVGGADSTSRLAPIVPMWARRSESDAVGDDAPGQPRQPMIRPRSTRCRDPDDSARDDRAQGTRGLLAGNGALRFPANPTRKSPEDPIRL